MLVCKVHKQRGFNIIELMLTLAIVAVLLAIAVPGFRLITQNSQQRNAIADINNMLARVRTEVAARHRGVTVCVSDDQATCSGNATWEDGWIVFIDTDEDGTHDVGEATVAIHQAFPEGITIRTLGVTSGLTYDNDGLPASAATFRYCDERGLTSMRAVIVGESGMVRQVLDGKDHANTAINSCT